MEAQAALGMPPLGSPGLHETVGSGSGSPARESYATSRPALAMAHEDKAAMVAMAEHALDKHARYGGLWEPSNTGGSTKAAELRGQNVSRGSSSLKTGGSHAVPSGKHDLEALEYMDTSGDGSLTLQEFTYGLRKSAFSATLIEQFFRFADRNRNGKLDELEFAVAMQRGTASSPAAPSQAAPSKKDLQESQVLEAFDKMDTDQDGYATLQELKNGLRRIGSPLTSAQIDEFFRLVDRNRDGKVDEDEFLAAVQAQAFSDAEPTAKDLQEMEFFEALGNMDTDNDGFVSLPELQHGLRSRGISMTAAEIEDFLTLADRDGDGEIDANEFAAALQAKAADSAGKQQQQGRSEPHKQQAAMSPEKPKSRPGETVDDVFQQQAVKIINSRSAQDIHEYSTLAPTWAAFLQKLESDGVKGNVFMILYKRCAKSQKWRSGLHEQCVLNNLKPLVGKDGEQPLLDGTTFLELFVQMMFVSVERRINAYLERGIQIYDEAREEED